MNKGSEHTKRIIFLNGPAGSGKDTAANFIHTKMRGLSYKYKMSEPLKESCHKMLGLEGTLEELEQFKELPIKFLIRKDFDHWPAMKLVNENGEMTLRQFYIHFSENVMKPMFGEDIFGRIAVEKIKNSHNSIVTISDSGFEKEAQPIVDYYGKERCCLVKIYRPGKDFKGDSRTHIDLPVEEVFDIHNNEDQESFENKIWRKLRKNFISGGTI